VVCEADRWSHYHPARRRHQRLQRFDHWQSRIETNFTSGLIATLAQAEEIPAETEYNADNDELARLSNQLLATGKNTVAFELTKKLAEDSPRSQESLSDLIRM
jgi:hypothetical protein